MNGRPRLTPHQREVLADLARRSRHVPGRAGWVEGREIGARAALDHLVRKGYAERNMVYGPRGGEHPEYRPVTS